MNQPLPSSYILRGMAEVSPPDSVSMMPQTLGWLVLLAIGLIILCYVVTVRCLSYQMNQYRREALQLMQHNKFADNRDLMCYQVLIQVSAYLYPTDKKQFGWSWLEGLNQRCFDTCFESELCHRWLSAVIGAQPALAKQDSDAIYQACELWLQRHRTPSWLSNQWQVRTIAKNCVSKITKVGGQHGVD